MKKENYKKIGAAVLAGGTLALPLLVMAATTLMPSGCSGTDCGFEDLLQLVNNVVKFLLYDISIPLVALGLMYAGGNLVLSQNKEKAKTEAKEMLNHIAIGFGLMLGTFLVVKFILSQFLNEDFTLYLLE